jgi:4-amino-4-deoxy-L-arabinose transferase-like glycosyltransferase
MEGTVSASPPVADTPGDQTAPRRLLAQGAAIGLLALALNLAGNGRVSLWDRDEPRYACCAREMRARADWVRPTFNGQPRYQKPVLIYWLMRAGMAVGGDNPFGARLASSIAGAGTCLLVWGLGRRMFGPRAGWLAALMLATAPIMVIESKLATTDATLVLLLVGCQFCLWELGQRPSTLAASAFWVLLSLATLTKGPVGLALIAASGAASWWWGGPAGCWKRLRWRWGLILFTLLTAPWYVAVGVLSRGEFFRVALGQQLVDRVANVMEQHGGFPGYYLVASLGMFYPWSALAPAAIYGAWARRKGQPAMGFLLGWVVGPLVLLECVRTKIVHYYAPSYPAWALLTAWLVGLIAKEEVNLRRWPLGRVGTGLLGGIGIGATVALVALALVRYSLVRWPSLCLAVVLASGTLYSLERFMRGATERAVAGLVVTWAAVWLGLGAWLLPVAEPYRLSRVVGERLAALSAAQNARPVLLTYQEPSAVYALGYPAREIRAWEHLFDELSRHEKVVTATLPHELRALEANPYVKPTVLETLEGFDLSKGRVQSLKFVLVRRESLEASAARIQKLLVK